MRVLPTAHGDLPLPAFLPDATRGVLRLLDAGDVRQCGTQALMVNALHLSSHPGGSVVAKLGGIHRFMGWSGPVASDSGGFQVLSLITQSESLGSLSDRGFTYRLARGQAKKTLTPEKCVRLQLRLGADILFCLDECTRPDADGERRRASVERTVRWARECKAAFTRGVEERAADTSRPRLFAVIQGGDDADLRRECAERLVEIGFDGYGYGGWPIVKGGGLSEMVAHVAELAPPDLPTHALGIGKPENVVRCVAMGYDLFDCTLPTRDARHGRLYVFDGPLDSLNLRGGFYHYHYAEDDKHTRDPKPVDETCPCLCCRGYSRAYLRHLFAIHEPLAGRLATIHNLTFYARLMDRLRGSASLP
jgi:queuine tRNA-ribosyltransferase